MRRIWPGESALPVGSLFRKQRTQQRLAKSESRLGRWSVWLYGAAGTQNPHRLKTQTHKGEGSNELRFEDEKDKEQIYIHAQKDLDLLTQNNRTEVVKNDSHLTVENDRFSHVKNNSHLTVDGDHRESIGGDHSLSVNGSHHSKQGKAQLIEAGNEIHHKAGMKIVIEAGAEVTLKAGGSFVKVDPSGVTVSGPLVRMNSGGAPGSGSSISAQMPAHPVTLTDHKQPDDTAASLTQVSQRQNAPLLKQAAREGALTITACEFDEHGRCTLHQHA